MNFLVRQQGNRSNNPIEQVEGRGTGNVDVPIIFSNNSNEFQAFMQEIKSQRVVMITIMEEMKYFREREKTRQEVASKLERRFSNELEGQHSENMRGTGEFHRSPMQEEVIYLPPHMREEGTLENIAGERPNAAKTMAPQRIFTQNNPITQPRVYEKDFSFNGGPRGIL